MSDQDISADILLYDWNFVDPPPNNLVCSACNDVLKKPMLTNCCGKRYCTWCLTNPNADNDSCHYCHFCEKHCTQTIFDKKKWQKILELDVICPFYNRGCLWTGELRARGTHIDPIAGDCQYITVGCLYDCGEILEMHEKDEHMTICPRRPAVCPFCKKEGEYEEIYGDHKFECPDYLHECPSTCGIASMKQVLMKQHIKECPEMSAECDFNYAGCKVITKRKYLKRHLQTNTQEHIRLCTDFFSRKLQEKDELFQDLSKSKDKQIQQMYLLHIQKLSDVVFEREKQEKVALENNETKIELLKKQCNLLEMSTNSQLYDYLEIDKNELIPINPIHGPKAKVMMIGTFKQKQALIKYSIPELSKTTFLQEAIILMKLKHENIIKLFGIVAKHEPVNIVLEYPFQENLQQHLRKPGQSENILFNYQALMCKQVAQGLEYMQKKFCIHRNLKAKNIFLCMTKEIHCKIGNFNSAKCLNHYTDEYIASNKDGISLKWCAPEGLRLLKFSLKSDVWSYGMFMYEVITYGSVPFPNKTNAGAISCLLDNFSIRECIQRPVDCPEKFYEIMTDCWKLDPVLRPTVEAILDLLSHVKDSNDYEFIPGNL